MARGGQAFTQSSQAMHLSESKITFIFFLSIISSAYSYGKLNIPDNPNNSFGGLATLSNYLAHIIRVNRECEQNAHLINGARRLN